MKPLACSGRAVWKNSLHKGKETMSKKDDISNKEYAETLIATAVIVIILLAAIFAGGAYAITKLFHLPWWVGVLLWLVCMAIWARKPKST